MDLIPFLRAAFLKPLQTGAVIPSSRKLALEMVSRVAQREGRKIVEIGPGTGAITQYLTEKLPAPENYLGIELNPAFFELLRTRFPEFEFVLDSAERLREYAARHGSFPSVVCSLPWAFLTSEIQHRILGAIVDSLSDQGTFSTYAYLHGLRTPAGRLFQKRLYKHFGRVEISPVVWRNVPPAIVYHCVK